MATGRKVNRIVTTCTTKEWEYCTSCLHPRRMTIVKGWCIVRDKHTLDPVETVFQTSYIIFHPRWPASNSTKESSTCTQHVTNLWSKASRWFIQFEQWFAFSLFLSLVKEQAEAFQSLRGSRTVDVYISQRLLMLASVLVVLKYLDKRTRKTFLLRLLLLLALSLLYLSVVVEDEGWRRTNREEKKKAIFLSSDVDKAGSSSVSTERHREKNVECERRVASGINEVWFASPFHIRCHRWTIATHTNYFHCF